MYKIQISTCYFGHFSEWVEIVTAHRLQELRECIRPGFGIEVLEFIE